MTIKFALNKKNFNTQYAPLGLLLALYKENKTLDPLKNVLIPAKTVDFSPVDKLEQILISILAGCETISEVKYEAKGRSPFGSSWGLGTHCRPIYPLSYPKFANSNEH